MNKEGKDKNNSSKNNSNNIKIIEQKLLLVIIIKKILITIISILKIIYVSLLISIYYHTGSSFIKVIKDKSKCSPLLMAILKGSFGLFYLIYKKMNLKEIIAKFS